MDRCPSCARELLPAGRFCPACGTPLPGGAEPPDPFATRAARTPDGPATSPPAPSSTRPAASPGERLDSRAFPPGTVLADRYRIVALLGRGGMGEVYRADDLTLGQSVALKFLPPAMAADATRLAALLQEVRLARQVSHPNVCRVYDIGMTDGLHFLTMEYIDGEDLSSLLRRIGRLPGDKAVDVARQLCAGVAAAHERGILHRDLKPSNIMIDGRGKVRVTDFGLADLGTKLAATETSGGTPAYMAPEQLAGGTASPQSDIYALGLVLYEVFTGKPAYRADTMAELTKIISESTPTSPSTFVTDLDPAAERIILRCLEKSPHDRPASALAVAAALPGGDPLAAALAAGETPSPELVAASGEAGAIRPAMGWLCLAGTVIALVAIAHLNARTQLHERVPLPKPPAVLADRAREILRAIGPAALPADHASGFSVDQALLEYMRDHDHSPDPWRRLASPEHPPAIRFWYRESPENLATLGLSDAVTPTDPPPLVPGMAIAVLDPGGRLVEYAMTPPDTMAMASSPAPSAAPDWTPLFTVAGIDPARLAPDEPRWTPDGFADALAAWTLADSTIPGGRLRIEAAAFRGRPVHFLVTGPWRPSSRATPAEAGNRVRTARRIELALILAMLGGAVLLAIRNLRLGRSDRKNAFRLAAYLMVVNMLGWLFSGTHVASGDQEITAFTKALGPALFFAGSMWLIYLALEPYIRRNFPHRLITWTRLMSGRFRDPLVGRDVLAGVVTGLAIALLIRIHPLVPAWFGQGPAEPALLPMSSLLVKTGLGNLFKMQTQALFNALFFLFMPLLFLVVFRKYKLSLIAFFAVASTLFALRNENPQFTWPLTAIMIATWIGLMMRYGLLTLAVSFFVTGLAGNIPLTTNMAAWYAPPALPGILVIAALAIFGLGAALGRRPLLGGTALLRD